MSERGAHGEGMDPEERSRLKLKLKLKAHPNKKRKRSDKRPQAPSVKAPRRAPEQPQEEHPASSPGTPKLLHSQHRSPLSPSAAVHLLHGGFALSPPGLGRSACGSVHPFDGDSKRLLADIDAGRLPPQLLLAGVPLSFENGRAAVEVVDHRVKRRPTRWTALLQPTNRSIIADIASMALGGLEQCIDAESELLLHEHRQLDLSPSPSSFVTRCQKQSRDHSALIAPVVARRRWSRRCFATPPAPFGEVANAPAWLDDGRGYRPKLVNSNNPMVEIARSEINERLLSCSRLSGAASSSTADVPERGDFDREISFLSRNITREIPPYIARGLAPHNTLSARNHAHWNLGTQQNASALVKACSNRSEPYRKKNRPPNQALSKAELEMHQRTDMHLQSYETQRRKPSEYVSEYPSTKEPIVHYHCAGHTSLTGKPLKISGYGGIGEERFEVELYGRDEGSVDPAFQVIDCGRVGESHRVGRYAYWLLTRACRSGYRHIMSMTLHSGMQAPHMPSQERRRQGQLATQPSVMQPMQRQPQHYQQFQQHQLGRQPQLHQQQMQSQHVLQGELRARPEGMPTAVLPQQQQSQSLSMQMPTQAFLPSGQQPQ